MPTPITRFLDAHNRYMELERVRTSCTSPAQREMVHIAILRAYLEVQFCARVVCGFQRAEGYEFADPIVN